MVLPRRRFRSRKTPSARTDDPIGGYPMHRPARSIRPPTPQRTSSRKLNPPGAIREDGYARPHRESSRVNSRTAVMVEALRDLAAWPPSTEAATLRGRPLRDHGGPAELVITHSSIAHGSRHSPTQLQSSTRTMLPHLDRRDGLASCETSRPGLHQPKPRPCAADRFEITSDPWLNDTTSATSRRTRGEIE